MQYESNPANGFRDIVQKRNTDAQPDKVIAISPAPSSWAGDKKQTEADSIAPSITPLVIAGAIASVH